MVLIAPYRVLIGCLSAAYRGVPERTGAYRGQLGLYRSI